MHGAVGPPLPDRWRPEMRSGTRTRDSVRRESRVGCRTIVLPSNAGPDRHDVRTHSPSRPLSKRDRRCGGNPSPPGDMCFSLPRTGIAEPVCSDRNPEEHSCALAIRAAPRTLTASRLDFLRSRAPRPNCCVRTRREPERRILAGVPMSGNCAFGRRGDRRPPADSARRGAPPLRGLAFVAFSGGLGAPGGVTEVRCPRGWRACADRASCRVGPEGRVLSSSESQWTFISCKRIPRTKSASSPTVPVSVSTTSFATR